MDPNWQEILEVALSLPEVERSEFLELVLETLYPDEQEAFEDNWEAELNRRLADKTPGIPWEVIKHLH